jgi:hypothetical protein
MANLIRKLLGEMEEKTQYRDSDHSKSFHLHTASDEKLFESEQKHKTGSVEEDLQKAKDKLEGNDFENLLKSGRINFEFVGNKNSSNQIKSMAAIIIFIVLFVPFVLVFSVGLSTRNNQALPSGLFFIILLVLAVFINSKKKVAKAIKNQKK